MTRQCVLRIRSVVRSKDRQRERETERNPHCIYHTCAARSFRQGKAEKEIRGRKDGLIDGPIEPDGFRVDCRRRRAKPILFFLSF